MTFRSRLVFGLVALMVMVAMAPSSFAQINVTLTSFPSSSEIQTNRNAQTADPGVDGAGILVSGSVLADASTTATTLRISYPSPITSSPSTFVAGAIPTQDPIRVEGATGLFATVGAPVLNTTLSRIEIPLPALSAPLPSTGGSFRLVGVRIDANGKTGAQTATASLSSSANNFILTTSSVTVINGIGPGIASFGIGARSGQTNQGAATIFTNRTVPDTQGSMIITEGFASAFRSATQSSNASSAVSNSTRIRITFNNVPTGVTLALGANTPSTMTASITNPNITATANTTTVEFNSTSLSTTETLEVDITNVTVSSTAAVTTPGAITATATLFPIGLGLNNDNPISLGLPTAADGYPVFAQSDVGPVTVVNIVAANTTMLLPYALVLSPYDTGLAIANTTADPFGPSGGGATAAAGTVTLNFFPTSTAGGAGTPFSLTTSSSIRPGAGLSSDGTLAAGAVWTVLLSDARTAAGQSGNFVGYVFVQANFLNAHGVGTISDFRTYSLATNVLVLPPPPTIGRSSVNVESLTF